MNFDFLNPVSSEITEYIQTLSPQSLGHKMVLHTETDYPILDKVTVAIVCVGENRGAEIYESINFDTFRKQFYSMFPGNWSKSIADLGDLKIGHELTDTYFALKSVCSELIKNKITPIIIGGSQDLTYSIYRSFDNLEQMVNLVNIDSKFDFANDFKLASDSYLSSIIVEEPNNLYNFSNIGYQTYYNSQEEIDLIENLYFDAYRLGEIINNPTIVEPILRDADIVSIDMTSIKSIESGNQINCIPNGFDSREICRLTRYAGISDKVSCLGIFNHYNSTNEFHLISQMIWYFIEGVQFRSFEYPFEDKSNYYKYIVLAEDEELVFYKSNRSERWWIEISQNNKHNNISKKTLMPCTHDDYLTASDGEIPERWWKSHRKL